MRWQTSPLVRRVTGRAGQAVLPFLLSGAMDWVAFVGTRLIIVDSLWVLAQVAVATSLWVPCIRILNRPGSFWPVVIGSVIGAWAGMRIPSNSFLEALSGR